MKNRIFLAFDADDAGQNVGKAVLMDDVEMLHKVSQRIKAGAKAVEYFILQLNGQIISSGGDELTAIIDSEHADKLEDIKSKFQEIAGFTVTIGTGNTLSQAGKALIAGKLTGKNKIVRYDESVEDILRQAHEAAMSGKADPEQQKMDEHYISAISEDGQNKQHVDDASKEFYEEDVSAQPETEEGQEEYLSMEPDGIEEMPAEEGMPEFPKEEALQDGMKPEEGAGISGGRMFPEEDKTPSKVDLPEGFLLHEPDVPDREVDLPEGFLLHEPDVPDREEEDPEGFLLHEPDVSDREEKEEDTVSDFESEEPIQLDTDNAVGETGEEEEKSSETMAAADEMPEVGELPQDEMISEEDPAMLEDELGDIDDKEELLQRIAANLDAFKQNKKLIDRIKQTKPDLYQSILGLLHNMIELASMIDPSSSGKEVNEEAPVEDPAASQQEQTIEAIANEEDPNLPKQSGWQG